MFSPLRPPHPPPPTSLPSLLNPTSMAGHRQPIKPGLGGYLHTLGCSKKVSEHAQPRPAAFTNSFSSFSCLSFRTIFHFISPMFVSFLCLLLSEPSPGKLLAQWGIQKLLILSMPPAHFPLFYAVDPFAVMIMKCAPRQ